MPDFSLIKQKIRDGFGARHGSTQDFNALRCLLEAPDRHLWITFEDGFMWWCTVRAGMEISPRGMDKQKGHFWLNCDRAWSNRSVGGKLLAIADLPGPVTTAMGFQGTVCEPKGWATILRLIRDEKDADVSRAKEARADYERAVDSLIKRLSPKDFEVLIDLILARSGWNRIARVGGTREGVDVEVENPAIDEIAFVQVKSAATQDMLDDYVGRFNRRRDYYARMIFAVHSPKGPLLKPADCSIQIWTGDHLARLVVRLGLAEWLSSKLG